jgi:uncharacterized protein (TIGR03086 family)
MTTDDPRPLFFAAADQAVGLIAAITPDDLARSTPCTEFDVRALAGHLLAVLRRIEAVARGTDWRATAQVITDVPDPELAAVAAADRDRLVATWSDDAVLDRVLGLPPGVELPGRVGGWRYTQELAVHGWDLAAALGRLEELDEAPAAAVVEGALQFVPREREGFPFGPPVEVPAGAGPYPRLVGWLGRDPSWTAPAR